MSKLNSPCLLPCKHMVAVAIRKPVLDAVSVEPAMKADGGVAVERIESDQSDDRPDNCDCSPLFEALPVGRVTVTTSKSRIRTWGKTNKSVEYC